MLYISASVYRALGCSIVGHSGRASLNSDVQVCLKCAGPGCLWSSKVMLSSVLKEHIDSSSQVCFTIPDSFQKTHTSPYRSPSVSLFSLFNLHFLLFQIVQSDPKPLYFRTKALVFVNQILQRYFSKCLVPWKENSTGMKICLSVILGPGDT